MTAQNSPAARAVIADDEPLLRESLQRALKEAWPELEVVGQARNGREAIQLVESLTPDMVFLDVHMPGINGVEAARQIGRRAQIVFVTAYEQYALQAFEHGAIDYIVKPVDETRLAETVLRLQERLHERRAAQGVHEVREGDAAVTAASAATVLQAQQAALDAVIAQLSERLLSVQAGPGALGTPTSPFAHPPQAAAGAPASFTASAPPAYLQWLRASVGAVLKLIPVDQIIFLRSDEKYTLVVWQEGEALIRTPLRELVDQLDPQHFAQVHRSVAVNLHAVSHVTRGPNETADLHLKGRPEVLPVSRSYVHLFRQM